MTITPDIPQSPRRDDDEQDVSSDTAPEKALGAEIGMSQENASTFEPEEDAQAPG